MILFPPRRMERLSGSTDRLIAGKQSSVTLSTIMGLTVREGLKCSSSTVREMSNSGLR